MSESHPADATRPRPQRRVLPVLARWLVCGWVAVMLIGPLLMAWLVHPDGRRFLLEQFDIYAR